MIKVYGIKTCGSVKKALQFFRQHDIEIEFIDIRKTPIECSKMEYFVLEVGIEKLFNNKGTKYRQLKLKELNLDDKAKLEWLCKENMLMKRPVIEYNKKVLCGVDENLWQKVFIEDNKIKF